MNAFQRIIFLCFTWTPVTWSYSSYDPCYQRNDTMTNFCRFDCCYDTRTCRENEEKVYLGVDSIKRDYARIQESGYSVYAVYLAYRFHNTYFSTISKYWKPSYYVYTWWTGFGIFYHTKYKYDNECNVDKVGPRKGNVIASLYYHSKHIYVCGKKISILKDDHYFYYTPEDILRDSPECRERYPFLCTEKGRPELIDAFTLEDENRTEFVVAYYGESQISDPHLYERDYDIVTYMDGKEINRSRAVGQLSAIDIYKIDQEQKVIKGLFATNDGHVCPFEHKIGDTNFDFEHHGSIMEGCKALQTYLGCPQAWCMDASFTLTKIDDKEQVFFVLHDHMWVIDASPLPINVPRVQNAIRIYRYAGRDKVKTTFVFVYDALFAAFTYPDDNGTEYVLCAKLNFWYYFNDTLKDEKIAKKYYLWRNIYEYGKYIGNIMHPDAAWFDKAKRTLYLFKENKYYTFDNEVDIRKMNEWKKTGEGNTSDLGLKDADGNAEDGIDAVVSMNGTNYFFNQRERFYEIEDGQTEAKGPSKLIQKDFFRVHSQCYYNDYEPYIDILTRHNETLPPEMKIGIKQGEYKIESSKSSESSTAPYIIVIVTLGALVAIVGLTLLYVYGNRQGDVIRTTVVTRYEEKQPSSKSPSKQLKSKSASKPLKSKSALKPLKSKSTSNSLKSKSVVKRVTSKSNK